MKWKIRVGLTLEEGRQLLHQILYLSRELA
jgi:hypothetical protein